MVLQEVHVARRLTSNLIQQDEIAEDRARSTQYAELLKVNGTKLSDPLLDLTEGWLKEKDAVEQWPPVGFTDIAKWLLCEAPCRRLFVKTTCTPSQSIRNIPHTCWVAVDKKSGRILSAYCSCFAGLGSTCNHVAARMFKMEHAFMVGASRADNLVHPRSAGGMSTVEGPLLCWRRNVNPSVRYGVGKAQLPQRSKQNANQQGHKKALIPSGKQKKHAHSSWTLGCYVSVMSRLYRQFFPRVNRRTGYQEYTKFTREVHLITSRKVLVVKPKACELVEGSITMTSGCPRGPAAPGWGSGAVRGWGGLRCRGVLIRIETCWLVSVEDPEWRFLDRGKKYRSGNNSAHTPSSRNSAHTPSSTGSVEQQGTTPSPTPCLPDETNSRDTPKWQTNLGSVLVVVLGDVATVQRIDRLKAGIKMNPSNNVMKAEFDNCVAHLSTTYSNSCGVLRTHWGFR
ncbi:hypothetical protein Bbelb_200430 [Branchiostoma belcheri]|nr:hypothetical protein Bbelb_200430 [Branchiostoma belcheri]